MIKIMNKNVVIRVDNLSKIYKLYDKPVDRLKEALNPFGKKYHRDFYALKDISFDLKKGGTLGIIGKNGAGKSTLLKILSGVLTPTRGHYFVKGKVSSLLELGSGFNPDLSGIENVYFNGAILGYSKDEMRERIEEIVKFADIGDFIDQPVKTYSSGMQMRLAFAVAMNVEPDVLILDEVFSVGDMYFQAKCVERMRSLLDRGVSLVFVSHSLERIKSLCSKSIYLKEGSMSSFGESKAVVSEYLKHMISGEQKSVEKETVVSECDVTDFTDGLESFNKRALFSRIRNRKADFLNVQLLDESNKPLIEVGYGQKVKLRMFIGSNVSIQKLCFGYQIRSNSGVGLVNASSVSEDIFLDNLEQGEKHVIDLAFNMFLKEGTYNVSTALSIFDDLNGDKVDFCDYIPCVYQFKVKPHPRKKLWAYVHWDNDVSLRKIN